MASETRSPSDLIGFLHYPPFSPPACNGPWLGSAMPRINTDAVSVVVDLGEPAHPKTKVGAQAPPQGGGGGAASHRRSRQSARVP